MKLTLFIYFIFALFTSPVFAGVAATYWQLENTTPLMKAAKQGSLSKVKQLLLKKEVNINEQNNGGSTPLIFAASEGHLNVARYLLKKGADPTKCAKDNMCPLWYAVRSGSYDLAVLLIKTGANPRINPGINAMEHPALHHAASSGRVDLVKLLLNSGVNIEFSNYYGGITALAMAVRVGQVKTAKYLIEKGANIREVTEKIYYKGETALEIARREGHQTVVKMVENHLKKISYKAKYSFDAIVDRLFNDSKFDMTKEGGDLDSILQKQTQKNLRLIRNTIFAKKNYNFDDTSLTEFYESVFPSYKPKTKDIQLNKIDKANIEYIRNLEEYAKLRDAAG